ncbi:MAG: cbb3-type cytochrome oxidase subunit 3 [Candidatus Midichloria sp.]|uniref:Cbb3-type cytochrome oxidase component FixQ n=1 Tax=Hyalomma marginatum TaxID=34627 RepID=A0A8S4C0Q6_9ACAR|nr:Cbb3-type cytochrome oxidase component FixQ [Hyalomma marginatum]CAG7590417.1 Cbb3-type cytochrome oxidase component FixQ [Hyalomma marginatum]
MNINFISIAGLVVVIASCIAIVVWLYRPNRSKIYDEYGHIPLKGQDKQSNSD